MKWMEFQTKARGFPFFTERMVEDPKKRATARNQMVKWVSQGNLWRLKNGLYTLPSSERKVGLSVRLASNILYSPSYVSLEFMLSFYGLIPERVSSVTAISTNKTAQFTNPLGTFLFRNVKPSCFFGYESQKDEFGMPTIVATPEKALLDKIYLDGPKKLSSEYFLEDLRLQNIKVLKQRQLKKLAQTFQNKEVYEAVELLKHL